MWRYFLPDLAPFSNNGKLYNSLYAQRTVAHFPLTAQNVVLGRSRSTDGTLLHVFDPITGKPIGTGGPRGTLLPYKVLQAMILPHTGMSASDVHVYNPHCVCVCVCVCGVFVCVFMFVCVCVWEGVK